MLSKVTLTFLIHDFWLVFVYILISEFQDPVNQLFAFKMMAGKVMAETEEQSRIRFQVELEFVQCLANPNYIHFLAQRGYMKEQTFVNYLRYLQYWREPEYARYLKYPMCLHFLELLQHEAFRRECVSAQVCKFMDDQAILLWQHYTRRRTRTLQPPDAPAPPAPPAAPQPPRQQS